MRELTVGSRKVSMFPAESDALIILHGSADVAMQLAESLSGVTLASIDGIDWNHDLTPWPGKAVFRGQPDFGGGAPEYLRELTGRILPEIEAALGVQYGTKWIAGYSLAGMFAVYAALESEAFDGAASVSGSLWYEGFDEYVYSKKRVPGKMYFSVGDRERLGRNPAFHSIEEKTEKIGRYFAEQGCSAIFELNPGGHFEDPTGRMAKALRWLIKSEE